MAKTSKATASKRHQTLIALLIEKREAKGMTQADVAKKLGQYQSFVARIESGQRRVDVIEYLELAEVIGFDPNRVISALLDTPK